MPKTISVTLADQQVKVLEHEILDIEQWVKDAIDGRLNYCLNILADEAHTVLMNDPAVTTMPAKRDALVAAYMARPDYKGRKQREADDAARRQAGKP